MNEIPKISITQDFVTDDNDEEMDSECTGNIEEAHTDMEDLDSDDKSGQFPSGQLLKTRKKVKSKKIDECATDIEDCQDSGTDFEDELVKSVDEQLSLNEFLDQGVIEETSSFGGGNKIKQSRKGKRASLIVPVDEDDGAVTDCEDLDSSDNELIIEECPPDPRYDNFLLENDDFSSVNVDNSAYVQGKKKRMVQSKCVDNSDSDSDMPAGNWNELSDVENIALSDQEDQPKFFNHIKHSASAFDAEEMILVASDNEGACSTSHAEPIPEISVQFKCKPKKIHHRTRHSQHNQNKNTLAVQANPDEAVTDVENLDSSDDEGTNLRKNLTIPLAYVAGDRSLTDVEDFDVDEDCIPSTSNDIKLPSPVREITVMRADKHGDPVAKVMPLVANANGAFLGIQEDYVDKGLTDTEDLSGNEDDYDNGINYEIIEVPNFDDGGVVSTAEGLTSFTRDRKAIDYEQLTDIEEIRLGGEKHLRHKRSKPKTTKTKGGLLAVNGDDGEDQVLTENEEIYVNDDQASNITNTGHLNGVSVRFRGNPDGSVTDTEEFSGDEDLTKKYNSEIDPNVFQQEAFFSTITSTDGTQGKQPVLQGYSKISTTIKTREAHESSADQSVTDVEDLEQTDGEDLLGVDAQSRGPTPNLLRSTFNECASYCVRDQSKNQFDISNEADHIKGYEDIRDNHTDIECLE